jgi:methylmalonyl-CoA mutase cobalamin-binding domain/chain
VIAELKKYGREDIMVVVGGVIPSQDYQFLFDAGVAVLVLEQNQRCYKNIRNPYRRLIDTL